VEVAGMFALELGALRRREKAVAPLDRQQAVLGEEQGMIVTQSLPLVFHVVLVGGVILRYLLPVVLEMTADTVLSFQFQVNLLGLLK
jgi:hypothetical protein